MSALRGQRGWRPRDKTKACEAIRGIEIDYGLMRTGARDLSVPEITPGAYQHALRTGRQPLADRVREQAAAAFTDATGWRELEDRLAASGFRRATVVLPAPARPTICARSSAVVAWRTASKTQHPITAKKKPAKGRVTALC